MLKTDKPVYKALLIVNLFLIAVGLCLTELELFYKETPAFLKVSMALALCALLFAVYYIFSGYAKSAAAPYRVYVALFAAASVAAMVGIGTDDGGVGLLAVAGAELALLLTLLLGKNMGKTASMILCGLLFAFNLITALLFAATADLTGMTNLLVVGRSAVSVFLSVQLWLMTYAKYLDKADRGRE